MSVFSTMVSTQMLMFLYLLVGVVCAKTGMLKDEGRAGMLSFLVGIVMPASILSAFAIGMDRSQLVAGAQAMIVSVSGCLLSWRLGCLLWRRHPAGRREVLIYSTMLPNIGNAGLPINQLVFGSVGVFYTSMTMLPSTIVSWTVGPAIYGAGGSPKTVARRVITNPNIVAVLAGFALALTGLRLPEVCCRAIDGLAAMAAPMSMALIGASLREVDPRQVFRLDALGVCAVRLCIIPVLTFLALTALRVEPTLCRVATVLFAMPVANYTAIQAELYGGDHAFASACVFLTTLLSLVTVPLVTLLF